MGANIKIYIQPMEYPSNNDFSLGINLPENLLLLEKVFSSIDLPSVGADPFIENFICTPPKIINKVKSNRKRIAKMLSEQLTNAILKGMENKDTIMGYTKKEYNNETIS